MWLPLAYEEPQVSRFGDPTECRIASATLRLFGARAHVADLQSTRDGLRRSAPTAGLQNSAQGICQAIQSLLPRGTSHYRFRKQSQGSVGAKVLLNEVQYLGSQFFI